MEEKSYDNVVFHRVIDGFMAQTGDVQYGNKLKKYSKDHCGMGGSSKLNLNQEFSDIYLMKEFWVWLDPRTLILLIVNFS